MNQEDISSSPASVRLTPVYTTEKVDEDATAPGNFKCSPLYKDHGLKSSVEPDTIDMKIESKGYDSTAAVTPNRVPTALCSAAVIGDFLN
mmetsp:Transcript_42297/g.68591  ORF Transcript_42297/g.68591 Transcript_42297/m.68591 type:complete len:90 (-) Transcript_42297:1049-1318(-)